ncbi:MAG: hypothetical protein ABIQ18_39715 [Umezawaea sp.]
MTGRELVTLHVVSPCEHDIEHEIKELIRGATFTTFACTTAKGIPRLHVVTAETYPRTVRRG